MMQDAEASRSRTCLPLENKKQNTFAFEITSNPQGERVWNPSENRKTKV